MASCIILMFLSGDYAPSAITLTACEQPRAALDATPVLDGHNDVSWSCVSAARDRGLRQFVAQL